MQADFLYYFLVSCFQGFCFLCGGPFSWSVSGWLSFADDFSETHGKRTWLGRFPPCWVYQQRFVILTHATVQWDRRTPYLHRGQRLLQTGILWVFNLKHLESQQRLDFTTGFSDCKQGVWGLLAFNRQEYVYFAIVRAASLPLCLHSNKHFSQTWLSPTVSLAFLLFGFISQCMLFLSGVAGKPPKSVVLLHHSLAPTFSGGFLILTILVAFSLLLSRTCLIQVNFLAESSHSAFSLCFFQTGRRGDLHFSLLQGPNM